MEISFEVGGYPPAKGEALSMLGPRHGHAPRVLELLKAAREAAESAGFDSFGSQWIGMEVQVYCPDDHLRSDSTNCLGGVGDVLEDKAHRGKLDHLGDLARFC